MTALLQPESSERLSMPQASLRGAWVKAVGLSRSFGRSRVLRRLDLELEPGTFTAVVGRSGCGKSTLLRLLAGLEAPTSGGVWVDAAPLTGLHPDARVMFQDARLMPWMRVRDNVALGLASDRHGDAAGALDAVGLADRGGEWPAVLSGGQSQRVALARALAARPRFLLLDEPLGALDALTRRDMQRLIERLWQEHGFTTLLITHDAEEAVALADRVLLIRDGGVALDVPIPLARPRDRAASEFVALREEILRHIHDTENL